MNIAVKIKHSAAVIVTRLLLLMNRIVAPFARGLIHDLAFEKRPKSQLFYLSHDLTPGFLGHRLRHQNPVRAAMIRFQFLNAGNLTRFMKEGSEVIH
jgi:hypothetical protein